MLRCACQADRTAYCLCRYCHRCLLPLLDHAGTRLTSVWPSTHATRRHKQAWQGQAPSEAFVNNSSGRQYPSQQPSTHAAGGHEQARQGQAPSGAASHNNRSRRQHPSKCPSTHAAWWHKEGRQGQAPCGVVCVICRHHHTVNTIQQPKGCQQYLGSRSTTDAPWRRQGLDHDAAAVCRGVVSSATTV